jgi:hypothetical protein
MMSRRGGEKSVSIHRMQIAKCKLQNEKSGVFISQFAFGIWQFTFSSLRPRVTFDFQF